MAASKTIEMTSTQIKSQLEIVSELMAEHDSATVVLDLTHIQENKAGADCETEVIDFSKMHTRNKSDF